MYIKPPETTQPYFLWGPLKRKFYTKKPCTIDNLAENILKGIEASPVDMLTRLFTNFLHWVRRTGRRVDVEAVEKSKCLFCRESNSGNIADNQSLRCEAELRVAVYVGQ
jgi:hypothetical protein